jgi:hypothetical protein
MNKLVESIKRGDGFLLFSVCTELMNNLRDTSGGYDIFVFGTAILNDHPIWKYGCKLVDKNV